MKAAFFFDTVLLKDKNNFYAQTLTYDFFKERYLKYFKNIIVSTRTKNIEDETGYKTGYKITNGNNVSVIPINNYKNMSDYILKRKKIEKEITNIIKNVDKVIIRMPSIIGIIAFYICKKLNKDYLIELVACPLDGYLNHKNKLGIIVAPIMYFKTKSVVHNANKVLYVTKKFLEKRYPTKGISYQCSDVSLKNASNILKNRLKRIDTQKEYTNLVTIGNVNMKYKGYKYTIKALNYLKKLGKNNYKFYIIGNGDNKSLMKYIKKYNLKNEVYFLGSLKHSEVFNELKDKDIYIQSSLQEGLPRAVIEAMSMSLPVIASNAGGTEELINKENLFKKRNYKELALKILNMNSNNQKKYAKINYDKSKEYNNDTLNKKRDKIYSNI